MIIINNKLGVSLTINKDGSALLESIRPRTESILADDEIQEWANKEYTKTISKTLIYDNRTTSKNNPRKVR